MPVSVPECACCLGCGYRLRDLPEAVCPECGRPFDPSDPGTFDSNPPARRRRRRIILALCALFVIAAGFALFPRELLKSTMSFTCSECGAVTTVTRWEPVPPGWIGWRYPGLHWASTTAATATSTNCNPCSYGSVKVNVQMRVGSCSGSCNYTPPEVAMINGQKATPETAATVLESMMSPSNTGIMIYSLDGPLTDE